MGDDIVVVGQRSGELVDGRAPIPRTYAGREGRPGVMTRKSVSVPLETGIKAIDA